MKQPSITILSEPTEAEIQHAAYLLWIENGRPEGHDLDHWLAARELVSHRRDVKTAPTRRRAQASTAISAAKNN